MAIVNGYARLPKGDHIWKWTFYQKEDLHHSLADSDSTLKYIQRHQKSNAACNGETYAGPVKLLEN